MDDKKEFLVQFGAHIRKVRQSKGISGAELARRCFMDKPNIHRLETGKFNPSVYYLQKICDGLKIELKDLFDSFTYKK